MSTLQELKQEADELGLTYNKNIGANKLQEKIEAFYEAQETSGPALEAVIEEKEKAQPKKVAGAEDPKVAKRIAREKAARETRVVTIIDNDQRVNNQTTTCTVNCSNDYFDLGTRILPLNEKIEVAMGHIKTLQEVQIPLHVRDNKTGLSTVKMRPRYTISFENV
jgi:folylpolyglutamate synthase/dihydropteroate synthase